MLQCSMAESADDSKKKRSASPSDVIEFPDWLYGNGMECFTTPHLPGFQADIKTVYPCMQELAS